jgi:hypothetical protein
MACTQKIAIGDSDLINIRFGPLCGLTSDILAGPRSADFVEKVVFSARQLAVSRPICIHADTGS